MDQLIWRQKFGNLAPICTLVATVAIVFFLALLMGTLIWINSREGIPEKALCDIWYIVAYAMHYLLIIYLAFTLGMFMSRKVLG